MSAYNWLMVEAKCPACERESMIRAQTHVASDYGGDETGRFHDREYRIGDDMRWLPASDPRYTSWRVNGRVQPVPDDDTDEEACYGTCPSCGAHLVAVVRFRRTRIERVIDIRKEEDWPAGYWK